MVRDRRVCEDLEQAGGRGHDRDQGQIQTRTGRRRPGRPVRRPRCGGPPPPGHGDPDKRPRRERLRREVGIIVEAVEQAEGNEEGQRQDRPARP